ncbi:MAG: hypothetical protein E5V72_14970 [Mesorhizobium sp.]|uniref:hypothetical protein n=1 Tax=Mesorhizobium sp. TaxID=1871066 RepID=UPI000FE8D9A8|nr:hypothetical protein [Mesorhizobium sp.]RWB28290.1 MAG: hypothetical protein EOQ43_24215 [Mesorhizobium sp.]RWB83361.1 MAG: hypothetical protein EOQ42_00380 [Mesorhizobium sp.]RWD29406.1 MAG: hypothetical protein EOS34_28205 [Mesorhizobium sp.]TIS62792.1 MAG: hypothetical protein E5W92_29800 [Mesorhizobium sp.]TIW44706.1 MAG: hypothetical protein E5V72_14970 [Mesorhizobium sp.]
MAMKRANPEDLDTLAHQAEYAKASGGGEHPNHVENLRNLHSKLVQRRRNLAQDAMHYPIAYMGRGLDIGKLQPVIEAVERAIADEERRAAN